MVADALSRKPFGKEETKFLEDWKRESAQLNTCLGEKSSIEVKPMLEDHFRKAQCLDTETIRLVEKANKEQIQISEQMKREPFGSRTVFVYQKGRHEKSC
jgi:hypothetical protein